MPVNDIAKDAYEFYKARFESLDSEINPEIVFMHLSEEIGEIARQMVNKNLSMRKYEEENLKEEIAQSIVDLMVLSQLFGMDLEKELAKKMNEMKERGKA